MLTKIYKYEYPKGEQNKSRIIGQARLIILILEKQNEIEKHEYRLKSMGGNNRIGWWR